MRHLGRLLDDTADQITSTLLIAFLIYSVVNGAISLVKDPPSVIVIIGIIAIGFLLGVLKFLINGQIVNNKRKDDMED